MPHIKIEPVGAPVDLANAVVAMFVELSAELVVVEVAPAAATIAVLETVCDGETVQLEPLPAVICVPEAAPLVMYCPMYKVPVTADTVSVVPDIAPVKVVVG